MAIKSIMTELKWFLKGDTNIKYLVDNGCKIWNGDVYKNYRMKQVPHDHFETEEEFIELIKTNDKFAEKWGDLGPIYGKQWRDWNRVDQIKTIIETLKTNPDSRRIMLSAWNVSELDQVVLPPCHYGFQLYTRVLDLDERIDWYNKNSDPSYQSRDYFHEHMDDYAVPRRVISLMWNQRSVDTFLGLPFNIASYAMLLHLIAKEVDMIPGEIIGNLGDTHLYKNHIEQAEEQISREPKPHLPKLKLNNVDILNGEFDYEILHYHSHPTIKAPLSN
jgi:thymidylate synthase